MPWEEIPRKAGSYRYVSEYEQMYPELVRQQLAAQQETQRQAAIDREKALALTQAEMEKATQGDAYGQWAALTASLAENPEAISQEVADQMYEKARIGIEAQARDQKQDIARSYGSRGVPGGAMMASLQQADIGKSGALANQAREIAIQRALQRRQGLESATSAAGQLAQYYGNTRMAGASKLAEIYGNTVATAPGGTNPVAALPVPVSSK